jgi:lysophospholipase L1-like esterase
VLSFDGPLRPRLVWQRFNRDGAASSFIQAAPPSGGVQLGTQELGQALASGWSLYLVRLILVAGGLGGVAYLGLVGLRSIANPNRARTRSRRRRLLTLTACVTLPMLLTAGAAALTVTSARDQLTAVSSLADLTGTARLATAPEAIGPVRDDVDVVVLGDSTAAGVGNAPPVDPTALDTTCGRSRDAYASVLQSATGLRVVNLACSSATLAQGVLGPQNEGATTIPPQLGVLKSLTSARAVVLSIGANDVGWSDFLQYCYGLPRCDDQASQRLFENRLDTFRLQYAQLLQQLSDLPQHPKVIVTGYYDPFGDTFGCPALRDPHAPTVLSPGYGFGADPGQDNQKQKITEKIEPLRSHLALLNEILAKGAAAFGYVTVVPSFTGHALCSDQPWVQALSERYPFHPNAAGELAIAAVQLPQIATLVRTTA